ncbi:glycosyltransferase family 39 protein [bacterium]|nr:glycosyltransferase family 39 protein [candidate division CSSED10-310 bacterium]
MDTELLIWIGTAACLFAVAAWTPWIYQWLKQTREEIPKTYLPVYRKTDSKLKKTGSWVKVVTDFKRIIIWAIVSLSALLVIFSGNNACYQREVGLVSSFIFLLVAAGFNKNKRHSLIANTFLWLALIASRPEIFESDWKQSLASVFNGKSGLIVERYNNLDWQLPLEKQTTVSRVFMRKNATDLLNGDQFSLKISGWLYVEEAGDYYLSLTSDDGSFLFLDNSQVIGNPGYHAPTEATETVFLEQGFHPLIIKYFNGTADAALELAWAPPNKPKNLIPPENLFITTPTLEYQKLYFFFKWIVEYGFEIVFILTAAIVYGASLGLWKRVFSPAFYRENYPKIKHATKAFGSQNLYAVVIGCLLGLTLASIFIVYYYYPLASPVEYGFDATIYNQINFSEPKTHFNGANARFHSISSRIFNRSIFSAKFSGFLRIDDPGIYGFSIQADNGAKLIIDNKILIDAWNINPRDVETDSLDLTRGIHSIEIEMYNRYLPAFIQLLWSPPGTKSFRSVSQWNIYSNEPDGQQIAADIRFQHRYRMILLILIIIVAFLLIWILITPRKKLDNRLALPLSLGTFFSVFLIQTRWMNPDHRYGFQWFYQMPFLMRLGFLLLVIALSFPQIRRYWARFLSRISKNNIISYILTLTTLVSVALGQYYLTGKQRPDPTMGTVFIIMGILLILLVANNKCKGIRFSDQTDHSKDIPIILLIYFVVLFIGVFLRFHRVNLIPPGLWWDEAQTGIVAKNILIGHFPPIYDLRINAGSLASYLVAGWFELFGSSILALRTYFAAIGVVTVAVAYIFFRLYFSRWWSLFGMCLVAISRWLFSINRVAMATIDETILLTFLVFIFYIKAKRQASWIHYILCGVLLGVGMYMHTGARVLPVIIGADIIFQALSLNRSFYRRHLIKIILMIVTSTAIFAPMAMYILEHKNDYFKRSKQTLLSTEYPGWFPVKPLMDNFVNYMKMYSYSGDWHPRHNYKQLPQLHPLISILAIIGFAVTLRRFDNPESRLYIFGFFLVSLQGILTVHNNTANLNRVAENIPIIYLWAVVGAVIIGGLFKNLFPRYHIGAITVSLAAIAVIMIVLVQQYDIYFNKYAKDHSLVGVFGFQPELTETAQYAKKLIESDPTIHVWAEHSRSDSFRYVFNGHPHLHDATNEVIPRRKYSYPMAIIVHNESGALKDQIKQYFPDARIEKVPYSLDASFALFTVFHIAASSADTAQPTSY